ncbi:MAG: YihY/virulence factor BrkB family protein [Clostridiales bacterium]|nr:YihY/virulence factor BrkB family protein [Clostridiales bacterium]
MKYNAKMILQAAGDQYADPYYSGKPAELSFYFMFSLIPSILLLLQLLATFSITPAILQDLLGEYISEEGIRRIGSFLDTTNTGGLSLVFALMALWGASKAQYAMMRMSNYAYTGSPMVHGFVRERLRAVKNSFLMLFSLLFGLILLVYGDAILRALFFLFGDTLMHLLESRFGSHISMLWGALRWILGVLLYFGSVTYLFYSAPTKRIKLRRILPGSLVAAGGMVLVTAVYSVYTNVTLSSDSFARTVYGGFASVTALLFWFFLLGSALVAGVVLNAALLDLGREETDRDDPIHSQGGP